MVTPGLPTKRQFDILARQERFHLCLQDVDLTAGFSNHLRVYPAGVDRRLIVPPTIAITT
jgi:hypothetical protein